MGNQNNRITPLERQLKIMKWGVGLSFLFIAIIIYTILNNLGLILIAVLGFFTYKKWPVIQTKIQTKLKPVVQRISEKTK